MKIESFNLSVSMIYARLAGRTGPHEAPDVLLSKGGILEVDIAAFSHVVVAFRVVVPLVLEAKAVAAVVYRLPINISASKATTVTIVLPLLKVIERAVVELDVRRDQLVYLLGRRENALHALKRL